MLQGVDNLLELVPNRDPRRGSAYSVFSPENKFRMSKKAGPTATDNQSSTLECELCRAFCFCNGDSSCGCGGVVVVMVWCG